MTRECEAVAFAILVLIMANVGNGRAADRDAPPTPMETVTDSYHGVTVADPYRWLEKSSDKRVHEWSIAQNNRTRAYLDALAVRKSIYNLLLVGMQWSDLYFDLHPAGDKIFARYSDVGRTMVAMLGR